MGTANGFRAFSCGIAQLVRNALNSVESLMVLAGLATGALLHHEETLLTEKVTFTPDSIRSSQEIFSYGDQDVGGTSSATTSQSRKLSWTCNITRAFEHPYCGFGFTISSRRDHGVDLSEFDQVVIELYRAGPGHLVRLYLKNFNPAYSHFNVPQTEKYNYTDFATVDGSQTVVLPLTRFTVVDWWKQEQKLAPELLQPEVKNVVAVELQDGLEGRAGRYLTTIREVRFERRILSAKEFYTLLVSCWVVIIGALLWYYRRQVARRRELEAEQLRWASEHDILTGLPNRRAFQSRLQAATFRSMTNGTSVALLIMDLDHFKHVNDSLGHAAGDELLRTISDRLRKVVRAGDFVARLGGDEFAIIIEPLDSSDDALNLAKQIVGRLTPPVNVGGRMVRSGASIGAAVFPEHADRADELFKAADTALYAIKGSGRGGARLFDKQMLVDAQRAARQLGAAHEALIRGSIVPHYQPKVDLKTGEIVGFEALLRCRNRGGFDLPAALHEAFSDYELASKIGNLMQREVIQTLAQWGSRGLQAPPVSINASPAEFLRDDYAERLLLVLDEFGVSPALLEVEVTEHVFLGRSTDYVARALRLLKAAGTKISLDDFGTGYSSLSHLRDFPVDTVKIDKSFIERVVEDPEIAAIVSAVASLAKSLRLAVVAEGIETPIQAEMLRMVGCDVGQGFLYGAAVNADAARSMLVQTAIAA
jgi:diguanylate cyclase (GGDEF)-like protein